MQSQYQLDKVAEVYLQARQSFFTPKNLTPRKAVWMNEDGSWMCETQENRPTAVFSVLGKMKTGPGMEIYTKFFRYSKCYRMKLVKSAAGVVEKWERA